MGLSDMLSQMSGFSETIQKEVALKQEEQAHAAVQEANAAAENQRKTTEFGALVETAYLVAAADGKVSDNEMSRISQEISQLTKGEIGESDVHAYMQTAASNFESDGRDSRIGSVSSVISDPGLRRIALLIGAKVAWLDRGIGEKEGLALQAISRAFDIPINEMHQLLGQAK